MRPQTFPIDLPLCIQTPKNMTKNSKLPTLLIAGAAIGAAAWYLFGTEEGKKLTNNLADKLKDATDSVMEKAYATVEDIKGKMGDNA
jgi:gas vesicle protein